MKQVVKWIVSFVVLLIISIYGLNFAFDCFNRASFPGEDGLAVLGVLALSITWGWLLGRAWNTWSPKIKMKKQIVSLFLAVVCLAGLTGCNTVITPGNVGIKINKTGSNRGVSSVTIVSGRVFYNPLTTGIIEYPTFMQNVKWTASKDEGHQADESITFTSGEGTIVNADIGVSYFLDTSFVPTFYVKFRADDIESFTDNYLRNVVRNAVNEAAGKYTVEQIMGDNAPMLAKAKDAVQEKLKPYGITIDQLGFLNAPRPPANITQSINNKIAAQQIGLQKQNELVQVQADAQKAVVQAQGQADANVKLSASLNDKLIEWRKLEIQQQAIQKWDTHLPNVVGANTSLFIDAPK